MRRKHETPTPLFRSQQRCRKRLTALFVAATFAVAHTVAADEYQQFTNAKNAFDAGEYEESVSRFEELLASDIQNPALVLDAHKLLAISYLFLGNKDAAEEQFTELLTKAPDFSLDPLLYPIEVIDFFVSIKQKNEKRFAELAKARALEDERRKLEEARRRQEEMARLTRNVYVERTTRERSLLVAVLPFGIGQFQNGEKTKGIVFLSTELTLGAAAIVSYALHAGLRHHASEPVGDGDSLNRYEAQEKAFRWTNHISLGLLAGTIAWGITDAVVRFTPNTVQWRKIDENEVPYRLRPKSGVKRALSVGLSTGDRMIMAGISGSF